MIPTETLKHEHQIILMVLDAAEREAQSIQDSGEVQGERIEKMLDFFRSFADRCHHAKEEKLLFAKMEERGVPVRGGPIAVMLQEHDEGRRRVRAVAEALPQARSGEASALTSVRSNLLVLSLSKCWPISNCCGPILTKKTTFCIPWPTGFSHQKINGR